MLEIAAYKCEDYDRAIRANNHKGVNNGNRFLFLPDNAADMAHDVFISYSSLDKKAADTV